MEKVSLVVPIFNEKENIEALCQAISAAMETTHYPYEIILGRLFLPMLIWTLMHLNMLI